MRVYTIKLSTGTICKKSSLTVTSILIKYLRVRLGVEVLMYASWVEITESDKHTNLSHYIIITAVKNIKVYTRHFTEIIKFVL